MEEALASEDAIVVPVGNGRVVTYDFDTVDKCMGGKDASVDQMKAILAKVDRFSEMLRNRILDDSQKQRNDMYRAQSTEVIKWLNHKMLSASNAIYLVKKVWFEMSSYQLFIDCVMVEFDHGTHICTVKKEQLESVFSYEDIVSRMHDNMLNFGGKSYSVEKPNAGHVSMFDKVATWANGVAREIETLMLVKDKSNATGKRGQKVGGTIRKGGSRGSYRKPVVRTGDADV